MPPISQVPNSPRADDKNVTGRIKYVHTHASLMAPARANPSAFQQTRAANLSCSQHAQQGSAPLTHSPPKITTMLIACVVRVGR